MSYQIAISQADFPDADIERSVFDDVDATVVVGHATSEDELIELAEGADALIVQYAQVSERVLAKLEDLVVVSRYGIGVDNVDVDAATERGVAVTNVPSYCEEEVATHALALLLSVVRKTPQYTASIKDGTWDWKVAAPIQPLVGNTVGFVAYGKIPRTVTELAAGFDFEYLVYDPYVDEEDIADEPVETVTFEALLERSDIVSVHAPLVEETRHLFDADAFERMRDDAVIVNTARGPIIDEDALYDALTSGDIAGAGLDVMADEPVTSSPLFDLDSTVVTPHVAWYSERSMRELRRKAAENVLALLRGEDPHGQVNEPATE
ncbi:C-terminal binding protein [haloarchaeon 3A1-DGR]|nr:C-terminal binding protein [haloarchaeon 3A1-DGR]